MSARFAELMALSASKTRENNAATEQLLAEKKRKEEQRLREQQARDAREREMQAVLVRRRLEEAQRAEERQRRMEEERARKEAVLARKEEQMRLDLIYGKDKRSALGASSSSSGGGGGGGGGARGRKGKSAEDDGDEIEIGTSTLTREEKRMRRLNNDLNRSFTSKRRDALYNNNGNNNNSPRRLGVGRSSAHDVIEAQKGGSHSSGSAADNALSRQSLRKQFAAMPQQLIKLNTVKRDTRTIDEIMSDLQRAKDSRVIAGDDARGFKDWFASREKEKEKERERERKDTDTPIPSNGSSKKARSLSRSPSEDPHPIDTVRRAKSAVRSLDPGATSSGRSTPNAPKPPEKKEPRTKVTIIKPEPRGSIDFQKMSRVYSEAPKSSSANMTSKQQSVRSATSVADRTSNTARPQKRKRSYSPESLYDSDNLDDDDPYDDYRGRGRQSSRPAARPKNDISSEIWRLFGKDRDRYVQNDVYSDEDDDMEVDADALRREELRSERLAKREDEAALEEERRHEEAKRRKKLMKDRTGK